MKKPLIIANWKMKLTPSASVQLADKIRAIVPPLNSYTLVLCPSFENIVQVSARMIKSDIRIGSQDCFWENAGAYTGEVSPLSLKKLGCSHVLIGHSERRVLCGEADAMIAKKIIACLSLKGLQPVLCIGEPYAVRKHGDHRQFLKRQVSAGLRLAAKLQPHEIVIAYEPLWAIGTGNPITPVHCAEMYHMLVRHVQKMFPAASITIMYGGSVTAENILSFVKPGVSDGALIGGASVDFSEFKKINTILKQR